MLIYFFQGSERIQLFEIFRLLQELNQHHLKRQFHVALIERNIR